MVTKGPAHTTDDGYQLTETY